MRRPAISAPLHDLAILHSVDDDIGGGEEIRVYGSLENEDPRETRIDCSRLDAAKIAASFYGPLKKGSQAWLGIALDPIDAELGGPYEIGGGVRVGREPRRNDQPPSQAAYHAARKQARHRPSDVLFS